MNDLLEKMQVLLDLEKLQYEKLCLLLGEDHTQAEPEMEHLTLSDIIGNFGPQGLTAENNRFLAGGMYVS